MKYNTGKIVCLNKCLKFYQWQKLLQRTVVG